MKTKEMWKPVTISGVSGILLGAGAVYGAQKLMANDDYQLAELVETEQPLKETTMDDNLSFKHAFDGAREELGPDGLFHWRGNIYSTCTAEEWNAKTAEEKDLIAQQIRPEVSADEIDTAQIEDVTVVEDTDMAYQDDVQIDNSYTTSDDADVAVATVAEDVSAEPTEAAETSDNDVRIVGYGDIDLANGNTVTVEELDINGQRVAIIDVDQDGVGDIAMSDLNHNNQPDEGEVIDLHTGDVLSFGNSADQTAMDDTDIPVDIMPA